MCSCAAHAVAQYFSDFDLASWEQWYEIREHLPHLFVYEQMPTRATYFLTAIAMEGSGSWGSGEEDLCPNVDASDGMSRCLLCVRVAILIIRTMCKDCPQMSPQRKIRSNSLTPWSPLIFHMLTLSLSSNAEQTQTRLRETSLAQAASKAKSRSMVNTHKTPRKRVYSAEPRLYLFQSKM